MTGTVCTTPDELANAEGAVVFRPPAHGLTVEELASEPGLERVVELDLTGWGLDDKGAKLLAKMADLGRVVRLQLARCSLSVAGVRALLKDGVLPSVRELDFAWNEIGNAGVKAIVQSQAFAHLERLGLVGTGATNAGGKALAAAGSPSLRHLDFSDAALEDSSLGVLFASEAYPSLEVLTLRNCRMSAKLGKTLAEVWRLPPPRSLDLAGASVDAKVLRCWKGAAFLARLEHLGLDFARFGPEGAAALAELEVLSGLKSLSLAKSRMGDEGAKALAGSPVLASLETLVVDDEHHPIGPEGAAALATSPHLAAPIRAEWAARAKG